jgi:hypothetical protein
MTWHRFLFGEQKAIQEETEHPRKESGTEFPRSRTSGKGELP